MTRFGSISALLEELAPATDGEVAEWDDVLARAELLTAVSSVNGHIADAPVRHAVLERVALSRRRRLSRRGVLLVGFGVVALIVVVAAAAYVLGHPVINFGQAQKGTRGTTMS
jgi:hypothetical protein